MGWKNPFAAFGLWRVARDALFRAVTANLVELSNFISVASINRRSSCRVATNLYLTHLLSAVVIITTASASACLSRYITTI